MLSLLRCRAASFGGRRAFASLTQHGNLRNTPTVVKATGPETRNGSLEARNLEKAVGALHRDGLVVVEDVIPHESLDQLNEKMVQDARVLQGRGEDGPFNYNTGNIQQDAPPVAEYFSPAIFTSEHSVVRTRERRNPVILTSHDSQIQSPRRSRLPCSALVLSGRSAPPIRPCLRCQEAPRPVNRYIQTQTSDIQTTRSRSSSMCRS